MTDPVWVGNTIMARWEAFLFIGLLAISGIAIGAAIVETFLFVIHSLFGHEPDR